MQEKNTHPIKRLFRAVRYSIDGFVVAFKTEPAIQQECVLALILVPIIYFLRLPISEKLWLVSTLFMLFFMELANTALEAVVDRISEERHPLAKKAKDVGSAMVFLALIYGVVVWGMVLLG